jgi:alkanesulfonate monooxygenase SsuD/methylene tetrahydromethanopterin reductase-like flavin-dependent oxidoreductase (luciferase family)
MHTKIGLFSLVDHLESPHGVAKVSAAQRLSEVIDQGALADAVGFERFGVGEHHFCDYILPNPSLVLAAVAARTQRIRLFTTVTQLACRNAIQLAEDIGVLDNISNGRLELSFARGVSFSASRAFGISKDNVYQRMEDNLVQLLSIFETGALPEDPTSSASDPPEPRSKVQPAPLQRPYPTLWIGGGLSPESCDLAVKYSLPLILPSLFRYPQDYLPLVNRYRQAMEQHGQTAQARLALPSYCWVAKTSQQARQQWRPHLMHYVSYAQTLRGGFGRPMDFEGLLRGPAICGSPAEVVDRLGAINELMGLDNHIVLMDVGAVPHAELATAIELMGASVLPHFAGTGLEVDVVNPP